MSAEHADDLYVLTLIVSSLS